MLDILWRYFKWHLTFYLSLHIISQTTHWNFIYDLYEENKDVSLVISQFCELCNKILIVAYVWNFMKVFQMASRNVVFDNFWHFFDRQTDRQTDRPTNIATYRADIAAKDVTWYLCFNALFITNLTQHTSSKTKVHLYT